MSTTPFRDTSRGIAHSLIYLCSTEIAVSPYIIPLQDAPANLFADSSGLSPADIFPLTLYSSHQLVIPQKPLYAIFAYASHLLSSVFPRNVTNSLLQADDINKLAQLDTITKIMMIQNSEHARALNIRKKLILARTCSAPDHLASYIQAELDWTSVVLGIAAHAKVGLLWHHRRWLLTQLAPLSADRRRWVKPDPDTLSTERISAELALIAECAKKYPRNYMAWAHRTWLVQCTGTDPQKQLPLILQHIERNPTDHTALQHLIQLLQLPCSRQDTTQPSAMPDFSAIIETMLDLVQRYPNKETPWLALRQICVLLLSDRATLQRAIRLADKLAGAEISEPGHSLHTTWTGERNTKARNLACRSAFFLECLDSDDMSQLSSNNARLLLSETRSETR